MSHHGWSPQRPAACAAGAKQHGSRGQRPSTPLRTHRNLEIEERRCAGCPGAQRVLDVALHPGGDRLAAPVGVEALDVEPQLLRAVPQVRVLQPTLVGVGGVDERPEGALSGGGLRGVGERERARVARLQREVAEDDSRAFGAGAGVRPRSAGT